MIEDSLDGKYPSKITDNIFQGGETCSENKDNLKKLGITHILIASLILEENFPNDFIYAKINVIDDVKEDILKHFDFIYDFINNCISNGGKILIHCAAGVSRSTTCTCVYLIKKLNITVDEALCIIREGRKCAYPNEGFLKQLKIWENTCKLSFSEIKNLNEK